MSIIEKVRRHGVAGSARKAISLVNRKVSLRYHRWRTRHAPRYANPTADELGSIENDLRMSGITVHDFPHPPAAFKAFQAERWFPPDYHGGMHGAVWDEKLLEHWISSELLGLMNYGPDDIFVDVAAANSPWAHALRERRGLSAYAIDLCPGMKYRHLPYYRIENATKTTFPDASVKGAALHCAYEMFMGEDDTRFIEEAARILQPGGKVVILPLYMHTHYCAYASPEHYGNGFSDPAAKEYIRSDSKGIPSSRKYDAATLKKRVLGPIESLGLRYRLYVLRNKADFGNNVYCHFILEITR